MSGKLVEINGLTLVIGKRKILDIDNFFLEQGETVVLIGPNGAGKSTLLQILMLLQRPTTGELYYQGEKVHWKDSLKYRRRMAMVFQEALLLETTVYHNVASGLAIRGYPREQIRERVQKWLVRLGIEHLAQRPARNLSGGESQRVSLARALALEPEVLFLDEPFAALDEPTRTTLISELADILRDTHVSCVIVTHNYTEIPVLADRVIAMEKGRIVQAAPPWDILARPASLTVASLVGVKNMIRGRIVQSNNGKVLVRAGDHNIVVFGSPPHNSENIYILFRPEDVQIVSEQSPDEVNHIGGRIKKLLPYGNQFSAVVDCGIPLISAVSHELAMRKELAVGKDVRLTIRPDKVHLLTAAEN